MTTPENPQPGEDYHSQSLGGFDSEAAQQVPEGFREFQETLQDQPIPDLDDYPAPPADRQVGEPHRESFFSALFDFSFRRYATPNIAKALYLLVFAFLAIAMLFGLIALLAALLSGDPMGILVFVLGVPTVVLVGIAGLAMYRVYLEIAVSLIRTSQSVQAIDERQAIRSAQRRRAQHRHDQHGDDQRGDLS